MTFDELFRTAVRTPDGSTVDPYPYQRRLAEGPWPDVLEVPTGLGKTAAVGAAWIYKRLSGDPDTPRRLVYCLPMRTLVEQTATEFKRWLWSLDALSAPGGDGIGVHVLMGGEEDVRRAEWSVYPEQDAVIIGTQDMLLSRALMRGYGMSRYRWPVHFALLHSDAFWVYDEVQLMGPGLATSAQLEAFRRAWRTTRPSRSLWLSATLRPDWLATVDFREHAASLTVARIGEEDRELAGDRLDAVKHVHRAPVVLDRESRKRKARAFVNALAESVLEQHRPGGQTLVIVNRVERAQALYRALRKADGEMPTLLLHARFRAAERRRIERRLRERPQGERGRIVVATQAVEAGVDISSSVMFSELAPWTSMVQRFGRCNRYGEVDGGADVFWLDIEDDADEAVPYEQADLSASRQVLGSIDSASPGDLPAVERNRPVTHLLRRRDMLELFDTDPDLSGFDVDVSPYIRDADTRQVQVYWRDFADGPGDESGPERDELCPVSIGQIADYLKSRSRDRRVWVWDGLMERWAVRGRRDPVRPGEVLLLRAGDGGYDPEVGFDASSKRPVETVRGRSADGREDSYGADALTAVGRFVQLTDHLDHVAEEVAHLCDALDVDDPRRRALTTAARWHDVGKAHPAFQTALLDYTDDRDAKASDLWAKSGRSGRLAFRVEDDDGEVRERPYFRHELASMLAWLQHGRTGEHRDLIAYLIAAHHGKVRMGLRALPEERRPAEPERLFARGVWDGDELPAVPLNGIRLPPTELRLDVMTLGMGQQGPSWIERTRTLLDEWGPFRLAWLEALVRIADWRASRSETPRAFTVEALAAILGALNRAGVRYLVAGGIAVNVHGYSRTTGDLDLVVRLERDNVLAALRALADLGYRPKLPVAPEDFADSDTRRRWLEERNVQVFSLTRPGHAGFDVDLFAAEPFDFASEYDAASVDEITPGVEARFVRLRTLIEMKEAAGRPRDRDDAEHLRRILDELEKEPHRG
ncbi:MAG: CRISPR-associated helicase Cas3' [Gemmatimonadota bacterium]